MFRWVQSQESSGYEIQYKKMKEMTFPLVLILDQQTNLIISKYTEHIGCFGVQIVDSSNEAHCGTYHSYLKQK